jgi:hypothetical protein
MPPEPHAARSAVGPALLAFLTLVTFTVSQSVYNLLAANQVFLALRTGSNWQLFAVVAVFNLLPAAALFGVWLLLWKIHPAPARFFLAGTVAALFLLLLLEAHKLHFSAGTELLWLAPAALAGWAAVRFEKAFRLFIRALSPVILLFPALFLLRTWSDRSPLPPSPASPPPVPGASRAPLAKQPPVFFLLLDEVSLELLLGPGGQIDPARFPSFHRLAAASHFYLNASANADQTTLSLPAILTGGFPASGAPIARNYPQNLFTLLEAYYDVYAYESVTGFCEPARHHCLAATREGGGQFAFLRDVFYLYAARVLPARLSLGLPDLRQTWGPFRDAPALARARVERFEKFLNALPRLDARKPFLFFFHHMLPHAPYLLAPDGQIEDDPLNAFTPELKGDPGRLAHVKQRYEQQLRFTDAQLGRFLARLEELGLYDDSLLIVTADHGVSYDPETPGRALVPERNAEMILLVPLFIKLPHESRGGTSERDVQLVDLVPTLADFLGLRVPWALAGRSVFATDTLPRQKTAYDQFGRRHELPSDLSRCVIHACEPR